MGYIEERGDENCWYRLSKGGFPMTQVEVERATNFALQEFGWIPEIEAFCGGWRISHKGRMDMELFERVNNDVAKKLDEMKSSFRELPAYGLRLVMASRRTKNLVSSLLENLNKVQDIINNFEKEKNEDR